MRPLGGQARTIGSRQAVTAATADRRITNVMIQAAVRLTGGRGRGVAAASRSIAVTGERGRSASSGRSGPCCSSVSSASGESSGSRIATHLPPQRAQRTVLPGVRRDSGTSYSAVQLGQAIRMGPIMKHPGLYWNERAGFERGFHSALPVMATSGRAKCNDTVRRKR